MTNSDSTLMIQSVRPFGYAISGDGGILATVTKTVTEP